MKRPENKFGGEIRNKIFDPPPPTFMKNKWLEKVKVAKVHCNPIIYESVNAR